MKASIKHVDLKHIMSCIYFSQPSMRAALRWHCAAATGHAIANGRGSNLHRRGYAGFGPCFHLPGFHFGSGF